MPEEQQDWEQYAVKKPSQTDDWGKYAVKKKDGTPASTTSSVPSASVAPSTVQPIPTELNKRGFLDFGEPAPKPSIAPVQAVKVPTATNLPDIKDATDYTVSKRLKEKRGVYDKSLPKPTKEEVARETEYVNNAIKKGDLVPAKDSQGNSVLKRGTGFLGSFKDALDEAHHNEIQNKLVVEMQPKDAINYLNDKRNSPESFQTRKTAPSGIGGEIGNFIGENIGMLSKGTAGAVGGAALAPETGGASFGTFLSTVKEMAEGGYANTLERNYNLLKNQHPNITDEEAYEKAHKAALVGEALSIGQGGLLAGSLPKLKTPTPQVPVNSVLESLGHAIKSSPKVVGSAAGASVLNDLTSNLSGAKVSGDEMSKNALEHAKGMAVMHFGLWGLTEPSRIPSYIRPQIENVVASAPREEVKDFYDNMEQTGAVPEGTTSKVLSKLDEFSKQKEVVQGLPLNEEQKASITGKLLQRKKIEEENKTLKSYGGSFNSRVEANDKQLEGLDSEIDGIIKTGKVVPFEKDNLTGERLTESTPHEELTKPQKEGIVVPKEYGTAEVIEVGEGENKKFKPKASYTVKEGELEISKPIKFEEEKTYTDKDKAQSAADEALGKHYYENGMAETGKPIAKTARPATEEIIQEDGKENKIQQQPETELPKVEEVDTNIRSTEKITFEKFKADQLENIANVKESKFDWRNTMDLSQAEREKGVQDIKEGNNTAAARKVNAAIQDMYDNGVVTMNRGRGNNVETRDFSFEELGLIQEHVPKVEKHIADWLREESQLTHDHEQFINDNIDDLIKHYESESNSKAENKQSATGNESQSSEETSRTNSGEGNKEPPTEPIEEKNYDGLTGIKNAVSNATRSELVLPKVDVPKLGKDVQVLHEGKVLVEEGKVNPQEVVNRIISTNNHNMSRDESKAMQYYMHQLGKGQDLVNEQLSLDLEPKEKLDLISQQQQLSDLQDAATEANIKAGKDWSDVGNIRQILIDQGFNPSREKAVIKEAYGGEVPKEVKEKLDNLTKERDEALLERNRLEELLRNKEANATISKIKKNPKTKAEHQQKRADLIQQIKDAKAEHDKYLKDNGIQQSGIGGFALTPKMVKLVGELAADYVVEGVQRLTELVDKVYEEIKDVLPGIDKKDIRDAIALHDVSKLEKKGERLEEKIKDNDIQSPIPKLKPKFQTNNEWVKANQRVFNAEYKIRKLKNEALNSQKNAYQKALMWASKLVRASVLSGTNVLYKLASAATIGGAGKRIPEQVIGQVYSNIFRGIAEKAPIEGFTNAKAEARFYKDFFNPKKFVANTWQILKSGSSNLTKKMDGRMNDDLAEITMPGKQTTMAGKLGKGALIGINKALEFPTDLHMVIKEPLKRAVFEASVKNGMVWAEKNGLDINDPLVVNSIENAAYKRANYEIFQEENALSKRFNSWKSKMDKGGNLQATGKLLADFMIPVSTVPTNIVKRIMSTSPAGLIRGGVKVTQAYRKGIENLTNEEADAVMRQLKQGTLGTALWLTGWFAASHFGGLYSKYDPNKKRQEGELTSDEMEVNGVMIPKPVQHALPLEIIQTAATTRHIYNNYRENKGAGNIEALINAALGSIGALAEHVPIISTAGLALEAGQDPYKGEKFKEDMQRRFEPQILRETGVIGKKGKTDIQNLIERNTTDGNIFRNELKAFDENGKARDISLSEFKKFKEERAANITERLKKLYDGKDEFNTFKDKSGNVVTKKYSEMTNKEQLDAIQAVKAQATAETKKKLFGKYESTDADEELQDKRAEFKENQ